MTDEPRARGVRIGVDVGKVRIGVAASDPDGVLAFPVTTVARGPESARELAAIAADRGAVTIYVGLPRSLDGAERAAAADAREVAQELAELTAAPVRLIDERFSTATASAAMRASGRTAREQRDVVDQAAAVVILDSALDTEKTGNVDTVTTTVTRKGNHD